MRSTSSSGMRNVPKPRSGILAPLARTECIESLLGKARRKGWQPGGNDPPWMGSPEFGSTGNRRVELCKTLLPPIGEVRIGRSHGTCGIERCDLLLRQRPADRAKILPQLLLVAGADDDGGDRWPGNKPVDRHLRHRLARLRGHFFQRIDHLDRKSTRLNSSH